MEKKMHRSEYKKNANYETHRAFHGQFVTPQIREKVARNIGVSRILASTDKHLNDIPLKEWDAVALSISTTSLCKKLREQGDWPSLGTLVCIAKEAARQIQEEKE